MAGSLITQKKDATIAQRLAKIEREIADLRSNQARKLDFAGLTLDGTGDSGSMSASDTPIITDTGLVSSTNFPLDEVTDNPSLSTTSTTAVDVTGSSLDAFTTKGTTNVLVLAIVGGHAGNYQVDGSALQFSVHDSVGGTIITTSVMGNWQLTGITQNSSQAITGWSVTTSDAVVAIPVVIQMDAGSHTLKLQYAVSGTGTVYLNFFYLGYIILGQQT